MRVIASARKRFLLLLCISIGALSIGGGLLFLSVYRIHSGPPLRDSRQPSPKNGPSSSFTPTRRRFSLWPNSICP